MVELRYPMEPYLARKGLSVAGRLFALRLGPLPRANSAMAGRHGHRSPVHFPAADLRVIEMLVEKNRRVKPRDRRPANSGRQFPPALLRAEPPLQSEARQPRHRYRSRIRNRTALRVRLESRRHLLSRLRIRIPRTRR